MANDTLFSNLQQRCELHPDQTWLRDRQGDDFTDWSWLETQQQTMAVASWLEDRYGASSSNIVLLSRNRAHWMMADMAIIASGNVSVPMFTTLPAETAEYIFEFTATRAVFLGEAENWSQISQVIPAGVDIITLPGVEIEAVHTRWEDIVAQCSGRQPEYSPVHDDLVSLVFTSGTTGVPKGVMQTHNSLLVPMERAKASFKIREKPRFLSYLPLSHIAERQLVFVQSLIHGGIVTFNESLATLGRDMADTKPSYFFGAPRVWEQLQQAILAKFGSQDKLEQALAADQDGVGLQIRCSLGLDQAEYLCTAAAPTPPALIQWYESVGLSLMEAFGQTENMATAACTKENRKIGSIGKALIGVEVGISDEGEISFKNDGAAVGYYQMPDKTAETFADGWVHSGDKGYIDEDGFIFLTGRVKDYFKTIQGKFVAPPPIEGCFADNPWTEQLCLLGRGYAKTVMVCVLSDSARELERSQLESALVAHVEKTNQELEKHARIGGVIIAPQPWTIENTMLTPTLKIRRAEVESRFGAQAMELALRSAQTRTIIVEWVS